MTTHKNWYAASLIVFLSLVFLAGCSGRDRSGRYGDVSITPVMVAPWWEFRERLQPKFKLDADELLAKALPKTQSTSDKTLNSTSISTSIVVPNSTFDLSKIAGGESVGSGDAASVGDRKAADLPTLDTPIQSDQMMLYQLASALYQEIAMLNSYVMYTSAQDGYTPYVVRLNIGAMIYSDDLEADMYCTIGFFTGKQSFSGQLPEISSLDDKGVLVVPMLVTDAIEAAQRSQSRERLVDIATRVAGGIGSVGGDISFANRYNRLQQLIGADMNSVFQVSRASDNTIRVKMGAANSVPRGNGINRLNQELVGRTLPVTLLILVPEEYISGADGDPVLTAVQRTTYRDPKTGRLLHLGTNLTEKFKRVQKSELVEVYGLENEFALLLTNYKKMSTLGNSRFDSHLGKIALAVADNNYREFVEELKCANASGLRRVAPVVWTTFVDVFADTDTSVTALSLRPPHVPSLPAEQSSDVSLALLDDGKSLSVQIGGGKNLGSPHISAVLRVEHEDGKVTEVAPTTLAIDANGRSVSLKFPWFDATLIAGKASNASKLKYSVLLNLHTSYSENTKGESGFIPQRETQFVLRGYPVKRVVLKNDSKSTSNPIALTLSTNTKHISGQIAEIDLRIKRDAKIELPAKDAFITISHASLTGIRVDATSNTDIKKISADPDVQTTLNSLVSFTGGKIKINVDKIKEALPAGKTLVVTASINQTALNKPVGFQLATQSTKDAKSTIEVPVVQGP